MKIIYFCPQKEHMSRKQLRFFQVVLVLGAIAYICFKYQEWFG